MKTLKKFSIFFTLYLFPLAFAPVLPRGHLAFVFILFTVCLLFMNLGNLLSLWANIRYAAGMGQAPADLYRLAILRETDNPVAYLNYAVILMKDGDFEGALPHLKNARMLNTAMVTDQHILSSTAHCYHGLGNTQQALSILLDYRERYGTLNASDNALLQELQA